MSYNKDHFRDGDRVYITADHLLAKGKTGTVVKWHHDNIYTVLLDEGGRVNVIKDNEMQNITGRE